MQKKILNFNAPEKLIPLAEKWAKEAKSFYLGPDNIYIYNELRVVYAGNQGACTDEGSWYICTEDCLAPKRLLYRSEIEEIQNAFAADVKPFSAFLYIDHKCNSSCYMCSYHGEDTKYYDENLKETKETLSLEEAKGHIDKLVKSGITQLSIISNGEILVNKHWEELYRYAASKGVFQFFNTNGFMLTEKVVQKLADIGNIAVEVSLHAIDFGTWSAVTRVKNKKLFETAVNSPLLLKQYGINTSVAYVKTDKNIHVLKEFLDYWVTKVDTVTVVNQIGLENEDIYEANYSEPLGLCYHSRRQVYIFPNGKVAPCGWILTKFTDDNKWNLPDLNIKTDSMEKIYSEIRNAWKTDVFREICAKCPRRNRREAHFLINICGYNAYKAGVHIRIPREMQIFNES